MQSLGQVSEVLFLLLLPFLLEAPRRQEDAGGRHGRLGACGTSASPSATAGGLFWLLLIGLLLHGICYDFFFVAGQIYTNKFAGDRFRSSAQGLITLATYGIGILIGSLVSGPIVDSFATADNHEWRQIWIIPAVIAAVVLIVFLLLFKDRGTPADATVGSESAATTLEAPGSPLPTPPRTEPGR